MEGIKTLMDMKKRHMKISNMHMNTKNRFAYILASWAAVLLWMLLIFCLSSQPAESSDGLSRGITKMIIGAAERISPGADFDINQLNHLLRKNAHFLSYLVLSLLVMNAVERSGVYGLRRAALTISICSLYAVSDEVHQLFVPGRGAQAADVLIDSAGALLGTVLYGAAGRIRKVVKRG